MNTLDRDINILQDARTLLARGWYNGENGAAEAVDAVGKIVPATSLAAVKWTPYGACKRAGSMYSVGQWVTPYSWLKLRVERELGFKSMYDWNTAPGQNQESILTVVDETIKHLVDLQTKQT